jgi:hypothetical protein
MILNIDPGRRPGYVLLDETQLIERRHLPGRPRLPLVVSVALSLEAAAFWTGWADVSRVIIEGQHGKLDNKRRDRILTLANEAGWQLCEACRRFHAPGAVIHPQALSKHDPPGWRDALRCSGIGKIILQNRVEKSLIPSEHSLFACASAARRGDCLDATAIGWGAYLKPPKDWSPPP